MSALRAAAGQGREAVVSAAVAVEEPRWESALPDFAALIDTALSAVATRLELPKGGETELGVMLADDAAVQALNAKWRGKNKPTNVLSFPIRALAPGDAPGPMLGDLVLALETLEREAAAEEKPLAHHFTHLVVHGVLHCLGHDHETEADAEAMEALETLILGDLGIPDPYRAFDKQEEPIRA